MRETDQVIALVYGDACPITLSAGTCFGEALAYLKLGDDSKCRQVLRQALLAFPWVLKALSSTCFSDETCRVMAGDIISRPPFLLPPTASSALQRVIRAFVGRCDVTAVSRCGYPWLC